jgi:transcriptional regulator GlxA family with amidase domain
MIRNVAAVVLDRVPVFELGVVCEIFGVDRSDEGLPGYDFAVVAADPAPLRTESGFTIDTPFGLDRLAEADLIAVPAIASGRAQERSGEPARLPEALLAELRAAVARGAWVLSVCTGAFVLGEAGLLDGRRCTTHWRYSADLARRYPAARVDPAVLYVDAQPVITSAGTAAGIDACLHLVRREHGSRVANLIARRMVVPPHRDGGQAQFISRPVATAGDHALSTLLRWMEANLGEPLTVGRLADRAHMSARTFARRFTAETGTTPQRWLTAQRILRAQELLEETDETVDAIAGEVGFGSAMVLRHHFRTWRGTSPSAYRRVFRCAPEPAGQEHGAGAGGAAELAGATAGTAR